MLRELADDVAHVHDAYGRSVFREPYGDGERMVGVSPSCKGLNVFVHFGDDVRGCEHRKPPAIAAVSIRLRCS